MGAHNEGMPPVPIYQKTWFVLVACLVFPPLGMILLWMRPRPGVLLKLAATVALVALSVVHLFAFYGMRVEMSGAGMDVIVSFGDRESHYDALEEQRAQQQSSSPVAVVPEPMPEAEEEAKPEDTEAPAVAESITEASAEDARPAAPAVAAPAVVEAARRRNVWTDFRGPGRRGVYDETPVLTSWPEEGLSEIWRVKVGGGYASMTVANELIYTIEQRRDEEVVAAYEFATGREVWTNRWDAHFQETMGGPGPRATPVWADGKIYALGATGEFRCIQSATGETLWRKNILEEVGAENLMWAMSAAPLVVDDKVIVVPGGASGNSIVAYDKESGGEIWSSLDDPAGYASPVVANVAGKRQLLVATGKRLVGVDVEDGRFLWGVDWVTSYDVNATIPMVVDEAHVLISTGYGKGAALYEIQNLKGEFVAKEVWKRNTMKAKFNDPVLVDGVVYGLDEGILAAIDAMTGERKWKGGRYGYGQLLYADGHLIVLTERGEVALVKATPEGFDEIALFDAISGKTWNNPALAHGRLLVRNQTEMVSYDVMARN